MSRYVESHLESKDYSIAFCDPVSNWDIYIDSKGKALSIAKKKGCSSTFFGDINYIIRLINCGFWDEDIKHITEYGLTCFSGLHSHLVTNKKGETFGLLRKAT